MARAAVDWGKPSFLDSAEYPQGTRPEFYHPGEFTDRHHFSPEHYNPPSQNNMNDSMVRPDVRWQQTDPPQPTLDLDLPSHFSNDANMSQDDVQAQATLGKGDTFNEVMPVDRAPQKIYRNVNLNLHHPDLEPLRRTLFGQEPEGLDAYSDQSGLFPRSDVPIQGDPRGFDNKDLHQVILDHLNNNRAEHGLGKHWSVDPDEAAKFNTFGTEGRSVPAMISAEWMGRGEDPYRTDTGGNYPSEREITMMPGAPLKVTDFHLQHPQTGKWHSVFSGPKQDRTAVRRMAEIKDDEEEEVDYCKTCGEGDSDWCEDCQQCDHCDSDHDKHCAICGPNDSDWCESCEQCTNCDWDHDKHCSSCGPNDSDWCEDCEQCNYCDGTCGCEGPDAAPVHLNTPLFRGNERPQDYSTSSGQNEHYFSPREINPASEAASRPYVHFPLPEDEDPTLDFGKPLHWSNGLDSIPAGTPGVKLFRGMTVNLDEPQLAGLRRAIYGDEKESYYSGDPNSNQPNRRTRFVPRHTVQPGMFPGPFSDKELAGPPADPDQMHGHLDALLDHIENHHRHKQLGLGRHWSTEFSQAKSFSDQYSANASNRLPVMLKTHWKGYGENPYRHETGESHPGEYQEEHEMNLLPGAPVTLDDVQIFHPRTREWHSLMSGEPVRRHAMRITL